MEETHNRCSVSSKSNFEYKTKKVVKYKVILWLACEKILLHLYMFIQSNFQGKNWKIKIEIKKFHWK